MGTRSLTHVLEDDGKVLVSIYRQFDGYPAVHGANLYEFLHDRTIVNGIRMDTPPKASNGMGCLAASLIGFLKGSEIGSIYIVYPNADATEAYTYTIYPSGKIRGFDNPQEEITLNLKVESYGKILFDGPINSFNPYLEDDPGYQ